MNYNISVSPEAENDIEEAFLWYEDKRKGLGHDFLLQVDSGIRFIERTPKLFKQEYKGTRKHIIKRFPYKIIYLIEKQLIIILAVIHSRRSPSIMSTRIDSY